MERFLLKQTTNKFQPALDQILKCPLFYTVRIINICPSCPLEYLEMSPRLRHLALSGEARIPTGMM